MIGDIKPEEEPHMGRKVDHARGKVLGGSSSINGMIYQRGNPMDYEGWAEPKGMETWDLRTAYLILKVRNYIRCVTI